MAQTRSELYDTFMSGAPLYQAPTPPPEDETPTPPITYDVGGEKLTIDEMIARIIEQKNTESGAIQPDPENNEEGTNA